MPSSLPTAPPKGAPADITVNFADVHLYGSVSVYDIWAQKKVGVFKGSFTVCSAGARSVSSAAPPCLFLALAAARSSSPDWRCLPGTVQTLSDCVRVCADAGPCRPSRCRSTTRRSTVSPPSQTEASHHQHLLVRTCSCGSLLHPVYSRVFCFFPITRRGHLLSLQFIVPYF